MQYFGIKGLKLPILISHKVYLRNLKGIISIKKKYQFGMIKIGFPSVGIFDEKYSRTIIEISGEICFHGKSNFGQGTKISVNATGYLEFGENFTITAESEIICYNKIIFGDNCLVSWDNLFMDTDFHKIYKEKTTEIINKDSEIIIGNNVWIGCRSIVLKGTKISDMSIIASGSTITKQFINSNVIIGGNPNKILKENINWKE